MSSYIYGVWQDGLSPSYVAYGQQNAALGTHVGNDLHVVLAMWDGSYYTNLIDITYNLTYCAYAATYIASYGVTYAATYYRNTYCNVRNLEWI